MAPGEAQHGLEIICLGTGTSHGVPMIGCRCPVCVSPDARNRRTRASLVVRTAGGTILIDTATELRMQAIREGIDRVDAVLLTHDHADHLHGIDDLRTLCQRNGMVIPVFGRSDALETVRRRYDYMFRDPDGALRLNIPRIAPTPLDAPREIAGVTVVPVPLMHGELPIFGYRIGGFAYLTDCSEIPDDSLPLLRGLDTLIIDGLRPKPHRTHFSIEQACAEIARLKPRQAFLTHLTHDVDHEATERALPPGIRLAYDGLRIRVP